MFILVKSVTFVIYSVLVYLFINYINISHYWSANYDWLFDKTQNNTNYDYIIVGAGSAGSVIASRLSNAGENVLLLEAGGTPPFLIDIPMISPMLQKSHYDWQYITEPQKHSCKGLKNHRSLWPMGKILGGSSRLNYMVYLKGHPNDFLPWFTNLPEPVVEKGGPLNTQPVPWSSQLSDAVIAGVQEMSHPVHDINKILHPGFMRTHMTIKNGMRWSTDRTLRDVKTLTILTNALATKILFNGNKAYGVDFVKHNKNYRAFGKKGVIVSAGAVGSPKLLMLSGIGPKQHLQEHKIDVIADLPVGQNLVDHLITGFDLVTLNISQPITLFDVFNPKSLYDFLIYGKGPWSFNGVEVTGTLYKTSAKNKSLPPDLQIMVLPAGISQDVGMVIRERSGISDEVYNKYFSQLQSKTAITLMPVLLHPKSTGFVKLRNANPEEPPIIDPNYLSQKEDVDTLIEGIEFVKKLVKTKAMQQIGANIYDKPLPGCEDKLFDSFEYWECYVRHVTFTCYHPAGTCKMGEVVDKHFRVYNTTHLYVVDASVFPMLPSGNTNAPVVMLAEKFTKNIINQRLSKCVRMCTKLDVFMI